jgi:hypothetical protein
MCALSWVRAVRHYRHRNKPPRPLKRSFSLGVEPLDNLVLLSAFPPTGGLALVTGAVVNYSQQDSVAPYSPFPPGAQPPAQMVSTEQAEMATQTVVQTLSVPSTLTNFSQALTPALKLFDPTLGTLQSVSVTGTGSITSMIETQNTSPNSPSTNVEAFVMGNFSLPLPGGLNTLAGMFSQTTGPGLTLAAASSPPGPINFLPPSGHMFDPLTATGTLAGPGGQPIVITDAATLAAFTASAGQTQTSLVLTANGTAGATGTAGNLSTQVTTSAQASVTVTYTYQPICPPPPVVTKVIHTGIHHQTTHVIITFDSPLNPDTAGNVNNYMIRSHNSRNSYTGPGSKMIPVTSAVYDPATNTVTLTTGVHLNVHHKFQLTVKIPNISVCGNGSNFVTVYGGKQDLGPVTIHGHTFTLASTKSATDQAAKAHTASIVHTPVHPARAVNPHTHGKKH